MDRVEGMYLCLKIHNLGDRAKMEEYMQQPSLNISLQTTLK